MIGFIIKLWPNSIRISGHINSSFRIKTDFRTICEVSTAIQILNEITEGDGTQDFRDQLVKQLESETWPSAEMDTSQVSVSSLPEDEKTEPTTANLSSTITDFKSGDHQPQVKTHSDEAGKQTNLW